MLSRVAERIYWLARYIERVENTARLISVYDNLLYDLPRDIDITWYNLIIINGGTELFHDRYKVKDEHNVVKFLLEDDSNPSSLLSSLHMVRENIRTTRDVVPQETWEIINELDMFARKNIKKGVNRSERHYFLNHIIESCQKLSGLFGGTMSRDSAWRFVILGRNIERADMTTRMLDAGAAMMLEHSPESRINLSKVLWSKVLRSQSAYLNYRRTVRTSITGAKVVNYLLKDPEFPRTFSFCMGEMKNALQKLPRYRAVLDRVEAIQKCDFFVDNSEYLGIEFRNYLNDLQIRLMELNNHIVDNWFTFTDEDVA